MTTPSQTVSNIMTRETPDQLQTVAQRIEQRLRVLEAWLSDGVPDGKQIPSSLNTTRMWEDDEIGIQPIYSPNDFTTTHIEHGQSVKQIRELLSKLERRYSRPKKPVSKASADQVFNHTAYERALTEAVSQWHKVRDQHLVEQRRATAAEKRSTALLDENREKDQQIADLRSQLKLKSGLQVVE